MRLIDADEVKNYILTEGFYCDTQADKEDTAKEIDLLFPTIKAIPIEWIREYICDLEVVISSMRKSHFPNKQAIYNQQFRVFQIKSLLEDWEKGK